VDHDLGNKEAVGLVAEYIQHAHEYIKVVRERAQAAARDYQQQMGEEYGQAPVRSGARVGELEDFQVGGMVMVKRLRPR
jgi:hypothetical protein